jgi:hypothetical protein
MKSIDVNTTSIYPTHFLRGVELIYNAREKYSIPSENWPHPLSYKFGSPCERYYAEVWVDGMDWQPSYWVIEEKELENPQAFPFIIFEDNSDREKFQPYDFDQLIHACLYYRRDKYWVNHNDWGVATDLIWPFLYLIENTIQFKMTKRYGFEHASQPLTTFWLNYEFIPEEYRDRAWKDYRNNRNSQAGHLGGCACYNQ